MAGATGRTAGSRKGSARRRSFRRLPGDFHACYTSAASQGAFGSCGTYRSWNLRVLNSPAAGRRLAQRVATVQVAAVLLSALACLPIGPRAALAVGLGGGSVTLGNWLASRLALKRQAPGAGEALAGVLLGTAAKWVLVLGTAWVAVAVYRLPPAALLGGFVVAVLAQVAGMLRR